MRLFNTYAFIGLSFALCGPILGQTVAPLPGLSRDGKSFERPKPGAADPFNPRRLNPYNGEPIAPVSTSAHTRSREQTLEIPIGGTITLCVKDRDNKNLEPQFISLTQPQIFTVEVSPDNSIILSSTLDVALFDALDKSEAGQTARVSNIFIGTRSGTVKAQLKITKASSSGSVYNLQTSGVSDPTEEPAEQEEFDYGLNPAPSNPLPDTTGAAGRGYDRTASVTTDKDSPSPEARSYNPYSDNGNGPLNYYSISGVNAPEITAGKMPTAIKMMRRFDEQRARGATTDQDITRLIISKPYLLQEWTERGEDGKPVQKRLDVWLAEAYRFPKYQTTAIRIVWNNNTKKPHYLDPTKVALKIGKFVHIPRRFAQVRNVVYPGQNNEMYLLFRIPDAEIEQNYDLILPTSPRPALSAGPQFFAAP